MAKVIILKNTTLSDIEFLGETIPASGQLDFSDYSAAELREEPTLITAIQNGNIIVNDGTNDLSIDNALLYVSNEFNLKILLNGIPPTGLITYIDTIDFIGGVAVIDQGTGKISVEAGASSNFFGYNDVLEYGDDGDVKDKFLNNGGNDHHGIDSAPLMISSGEVTHITISTEKNPNDTVIIQVITNAKKGGSGQFSGGTQIGINLETTVGQLDELFKNLTGFNFNAGDRLAIRLKKGTNGGGRAHDPLVRVFVRYD